MAFMCVFCFLKNFSFFKFGTLWKDKNRLDVKLMKKAIKFFCIISFVFCSFVFASVYFMSNSVSDNYKINRGDELRIDSIIPVTAVYNGAKMSQSNSNHLVGEKFKVDLKIFGVIPFSTVNVEVIDDMYVQALGNPFGMKIYTDGVLVVEGADIMTQNGKANPAQTAGIKVGDYIKSVNGKLVTCNEDLLQIVTESGGKSMKFCVVRDGQEFSCDVQPVLDSDSGLYRIGIWVRDSSAGIGTLTFYSPANDVVCGLGHGICDSDTETLLSVNEGELVEADIISVEKGSAGSPGALKGKLTYDTIADIALNCEQGVYGIMQQNTTSVNLTEVALKQEVYDGKAQILCTVNGTTPKLYSCEIKRYNSNDSLSQNLVVTITDAELINATGGIVQGMSGSPILQNGKLVGALTHVLVSDSHTGYGIYAENMLEVAESVAEDYELKEAS